MLWHDQSFGRKPPDSYRKTSFQRIKINVAEIYQWPCLETCCQSSTSLWQASTTKTFFFNGFQNLDKKKTEQRNPRWRKWIGPSKLKVHFFDKSLTNWVWQKKSESWQKAFSRLSTFSVRGKLLFLTVFRCFSRCCCCCSNCYRCCCWSSCCCKV